MSKDGTLKKRIEFIGMIAVVVSVVMVTSLVDQIRLNLSGVRGSIIYPAIYITNITLWTAYITLKNGVDKKIIYVNTYAVIMQLINLITAGGLI